LALKKFKKKSIYYRSIMRGFKIANGFSSVNLPVRKTVASAGYDFETIIDFEIAPGEIKLIPTGVKAFFPTNEVLKLYIRSSMTLKSNIVMANSVGIIDSDYYNNPDNDGHIQFMLHNIGTTTKAFKSGDRIGQGIFEHYLMIDDDHVTESRIGGFGSTTTK